MKNKRKDKHLTDVVWRTLVSVRLMLAYWDHERGVYDPEVVDYEQRAGEVCDFFIEEFALWEKARMARRLQNLEGD